MPLVPTFGKNEQSLPGAVAPRWVPGPQAGCFCSSFEPASAWVPSGAIATVGSFCLFVGKRAVAFDVASPAICGWLACASVADLAIAVPAAAITNTMATSNASGDLRMVDPPRLSEARQDAAGAS